MAQEKMPDGTDAPLEFLPQAYSRDCDEEQPNAPSWGVPAVDFPYIWYGNHDEEEYKKDAEDYCLPWYHKTGQIDQFWVNISLAGANGTSELLVTTALKAASVSDADGNVLSVKKDFDISHPTKKGYRLRHVCLEGPEAGVYVRGRLTGQNVIELPEYWKGLVDPETITVTLTQIKTSQDLIVDSIEWGSRIKIISGNGTSIDCYYHVQAERNDGEKLIPEYEGTTIEDYPGNNEEYSHNR